MKTLKMKSKCVALFIVCLLSVHLGKAEKTNEKTEVFGISDYFMGGSFDDDVTDKFNNYSSFLGTFGVPAGTEIETSGAIGGRIGALFPISPSFSGGFSVGVVNGPSIDALLRDMFLFNPGNINAEFKSIYIRLMAEGKLRKSLSKSFAITLGGAAGIARASGELKYRGNGFYEGSDYSKKESKIGPSFEISPGIELKVGQNTSLVGGVRYSVFPALDIESDPTRDAITVEKYELDWKAFGFFLGLAF